MHIRVLAALNVAIAIALGAFAYVMLPYAHGVRCEALSQVPCVPLAGLSQLLAALLPLAVTAAILLAAFRIHLSRPRTGSAILLVGPLALLTWLVIAWASSAS
jgi:hypothetical protein